MTTFPLVHTRKFSYWGKGQEGLVAMKSDLSSYPPAPKSLLSSLLSTLPPATAGMQELGDVCRDRYTRKEEQN